MADNKEMDLVKEPNPPFPIEIVDTKPVEVANPFSGEKVVLQPTAIAVYDAIKGAEMLNYHETVEAGVDWFREHYPKEYMVLLD
jgi:hypothetical protein|tara:strand:- start:358 stop:609 length:252 start_codon:yes stop_codon:yes gene_type:complete